MGDKGAPWGEEGPGVVAVAWELRAACGEGQGLQGRMRGITVAAWFLGLEFTAALARLSAPFCLSAGAENER